MFSNPLAQRGLTQCSKQCRLKVPSKRRWRFPRLLYSSKRFEVGLNPMRRVTRVRARTRGETADQHVFPVARFAITVLILSVAVTRAVQAQSQSEEYRVKAALLFHFAQLVDWPPSAFASDNSAINVCTIGQDPFEGELDSSLSGKSVGMRPVHIEHVKEPREITGCQMLFLGAKESKRLPAILAEVGKAPVMTVGESDGFLEQGGMVRLDVEDGKVRFAINLDASEQAGL